MVTTLFLDQILYLHSLDRWGKVNISFWVFWVLIVENNPQSKSWSDPHAKETFWGGKFCSPTKAYIIENMNIRNKQIDKNKLWGKNLVYYLKQSTNSIPGSSKLKS